MLHRRNGTSKVVIVLPLFSKMGQEEWIQSNIDLLHKCSALFICQHREAIFHVPSLQTEHFIADCIFCFIMFEGLMTKPWLILLYILCLSFHGNRYHWTPWELFVNTIIYVEGKWSDMPIRRLPNYHVQIILICKNIIQGGVINAECRKRKVSIWNASVQVFSKLEGGRWESLHTILKLELPTKYKFF